MVVDSSGRMSYATTDDTTWRTTAPLIGETEQLIASCGLEGCFAILRTLGGPWRLKPRFVGCAGSFACSGVKASTNTHGGAGDLKMVNDQYQRSNTTGSVTVRESYKCAAILDRVGGEQIAHRNANLSQPGSAGRKYPKPTLYPSRNTPA